MQEMACSNPNLTLEEYHRNGCDLLDTLSAIPFRLSGDPLQEFLIGVCADNAPLCEEVLMSKCSNFTRDTVVGSTVLTRMCGCFMNREQYKVARECDPLCLKDGIKRVTTCSANICIINGLDIDITDSSAGDIVVSQQCSGCTTGSGCICYMNDIDITVKNSRTGTIQLDQADSCATITCVTSDGLEITGDECDEFFMSASSAQGNISIREKNLAFLRIITPLTWGIILILLMLAVIYTFSPQKQSES